MCIFVLDKDESVHRYAVRGVKEIETERKRYIEIDRERETKRGIERDR